MDDIVEKIIKKLRADTALKTMTNEIAHMVVNQKTALPYLLIYDFPTTDVYNFDEYAYGGTGFRFEAVSDLKTATKSGYTITKEILNRVYEILQDCEDEIGVTENGDTLNFRRHKPNGTKIVTKSGGEQYMTRSHDYDCTYS